MSKFKSLSNLISGKVTLWVTGLMLTLFQFTAARAQFSDSARDVNWSAAGLTFDNFRIVQPARKGQQLSVGAVTSSQPGVEVSVSDIDLQRILKISMTNRFNYNKSWVSADALKDSGLLQHEQGHFDLNEIYTRKTFQQFQQVKFTNNFKAEIATIMEAMNKELSKVQKNYERQTLHGLLKENQAIWNQRIAMALQQLPPYENKHISQTLPPENGSKATEYRRQ